MSAIEPMQPSRRRRRGSLTRERVLAAAYALAEEHGLSALTMPDLAHHLDVGVTGLYWHYRTKDDLIRAMSMPAMTRLDSLMMRPTDENPNEWRQFLGSYFCRLRTVYNDNPVLADIMLIGPSPHESEAVTLAYTAVDTIVEYLVSAGFSHETAWYLFCTALHFTQSAVIAERARARYGEPLGWLQDSNRVQEQGWATLAALTAGGDVDLDMTGERAFRAGIDLIIGGAEPESPCTRPDALT